VRKEVKEKNSHMFKKGEIDVDSMAEHGGQLMEKEGRIGRCSTTTTWCLWCGFSGGSDTRKMERRKKMRCMLEGLSLGVCMARW